MKQCNPSSSKENGKGAPFKQGGKKWDKSKTDRRDVEALNALFKSEDNDKAWYDRYPQNVKDAGALSFGVPLGEELQVSPAVPELSVNPIEYTGPGIVKIRFVPGIGVSTDKASPINRAALNIFVKLRAYQKAAKDYDSQDMMMGLIAIDGLFMFHSLGRRAYATINSKQPTMNEYYTRTLLYAMGFDPEDVILHLADLRSYLNTFAATVSKYTLPSGLTLVDRHMWMCQGLYLDADAVQAQTYLFVPEGIYMYDNTVATGSQLTLEPWPENSMTVAQYIAMGEKLIAAINGDDDIGFICGDLDAAYGTSAMRALPVTENALEIVPSYSEEVLAQITNIRFVGGLLSGQANISQNPSVNNGAIIWNPSFFNIMAESPGWITADYLAGNMLLNSHGKHDPEDVIEMTRLAPVCGQIMNDGVNHVHLLKACGTEVCTTWSVFFKPYDKVSGDEGFFGGKWTNSVAIPVSATWAQANLWFHDAELLQSFDWSWLLGVYSQGSASTGLSGFMWDIEKLTIVSPKDLEQMHLTALISEFDIPGMS